MAGIESAVSGIITRNWDTIDGTQSGFLATVYGTDGRELAQASFPVIAAAHEGGYEAAADNAYATAKRWLALWNLSPR